MVIGRNTSLGLSQKLDDRARPAVSFKYYAAIVTAFNHPSPQDGSTVQKEVSMAVLDQAAQEQYDAFISYSRKNKTFADRLAKVLGEYRPPKDLDVPQRRLSAFLDVNDFTGAEYYRSLDRNLRRSRKLIVLCSPDARQSAFVNDEIRRFVEAQRGERDRPHHPDSGRWSSQQRG